MKIVSWNVNGLRAVIKKDFIESFKNLKADVFCMQETKLQKNQIPVEIFDLKYKDFWSFALKKGYSGTGLLCKILPIKVEYSIGKNDFLEEGRNIVIELEDFYIINAYVPNAQPKLKRIDFRTEYEMQILKYLKKLDKIKPVIYCGDLNVAHEEIDLKNPKQNIGEPGFSYEERGMMDKLLSSGFVDVYRYLNPKKQEYTWWSYRANARENNVGWRIDYFIVSERLLSKIKSVKIHNEIFGSDHCPIELCIK